MDVALVLEAAELLDSELMNIHYRLRDLAAWPRECDVASIRVSLRAVLLLTRGLRDQALAARLNTGSTELRAASLRARGVVVALQVSVLERAIETSTCGVEATAVTKAAFARFSERLLGYVGRINASWILEANRLPRAARADFDSVLDRAEEGYSALGRDEELVAVITRGCADRPGVVSSACRVLAAILEIPLGQMPEHLVQ